MMSWIHPKMYFTIEQLCIFMLPVYIYLRLGILLFIYCSNTLRPQPKPSPALAGRDTSKYCECECCHRELQQSKEKNHYREYFTERKLRNGEKKCLGQGLQESCRRPFLPEQHSQDKITALMKHSQLTTLS